MNTSRAAAIGLIALGIARASFAQQPTVRLEDNPESGELVVVIGPVSLPSGGAYGHGAHGTVSPPVETVLLPFDGYLYGVAYELVDATGRLLPNDLLHHLNLIDPDHRELFLPISQRIVAVGRETGAQSIPWFLFGYPVSAGQRMVVSVMLHNPTSEDYKAVSVRFHLKYVKANRPWPLFSVYPFHIDVAFPVGDKSFDLPPGRSTWSYKGSPALPGRLMVVISHMHEYAERITLEDVTEGRLIWEGFPIKDAEGNLKGVTIGRLYRKLGVKIFPERVYRVTITYNNTTPDTLFRGGMGVVGGLFMPAGGVEWPKADTNDPLYALDRKHYLREVRGRFDVIVKQSEHEQAPETMPMHRHGRNPLGRDDRRD